MKITNVEPGVRVDENLRAKSNKVNPRRILKAKELSLSRIGLARNTKMSGVGQRVTK